MEEESTRQTRLTRYGQSMSEDCSNYFFDTIMKCRNFNKGS
jgi:hypothetical protein